MGIDWGFTEREMRTQKNTETQTRRGEVDLIHRVSRTRLRRPCIGTRFAFCVVGVGVALLILAGGCRGKTNKAAVANSNVSGEEKNAIEVQWAAGARCANESVNEFVADAVHACATGDYEKYRLLWRYDHRPTSRKVFERRWQSVQRVEIKAIRRVVFRYADGTIRSPDPRSPELPVYMFHVFVEVKPEVREKISRSNDQGDDRDLVLLIVQEEGAWQLMPAPDRIRDSVLGTANAKSTTGTKKEK